MLIGSHVSAAGGIHNAVTTSINRGCVGTFAMFLSSPRTWRTKSSFSEEEVQLFKQLCSENGYRLDKILPHGNYLINLASENPDLLQKSRNMFHTELKKCQQLGISLYNFHPGSPGKGTAEQRKNALIQVADEINKAHSAIPNICLVAENMAGQGNVLCRDFHEISTIIAHVEDKTRVGVCLDTCHLFAAGFDFRDEGNYMKIVQDFDDIVGLRYLRAFHLNDSLDECGKKKDRHMDIGKGKIGEEAFKRLLQDDRFLDVTFITETPAYGEECKNELNRLKEFRSSRG